MFYSQEIGIILFHCIILPSKINSKTEVLLKKNDWDIIENGVSQASVSKSLFKFFSLNKFSLDSLLKGYVYSSNPKDFNDPFDCNRKEKS